MISINDLKTLRDNDGMTLKNGEKINYSTGFQVADHGFEMKEVEEAYKAIKDMDGNCGVWYSDGIYYIDHSFRVKTLKRALAIGRAHKQISIFGWKKKNLIFC